MDEMVGGIKGIETQVDEYRIVKNIFRNLPDAYSENVSSIEELIDYNTYTKEILLNILISLEMRNHSLRNGSKKKTNLKSTKFEYLDEENLDEVEHKFVRRIRKGSSKYNH
jgi:hypothetical protein